jgi:hypothetical protein
MKTSQFRKFDMLRRVQRYLDDSAATLAGVNATAARKELDRIVQEMAVNEAADATSALNARSQTAKLAVRRSDLWTHHMLPVATIAAAHLRLVPEFKALKMPIRRVKSAVLVQDAVAMGEAAREHSQVFVENGRPQNFADALVAAAVAVRTAIDERGKSIGTGASARSGLKATGARAQVVLRLLDAQVKSVLVDDPKALAGWNSAKRIGKGRVTPLEMTTPANAPQATEVKAA